MRRLLITAAILAIPGALTIAGPIAVVVMLLRRRREKNRVTIVHVKPAPVLRVHRGGKA